MPNRRSTMNSSRTAGDAACIPICDQHRADDDRWTFQAHKGVAVQARIIGEETSISCSQQETFFCKACLWASSSVSNRACRKPASHHLIAERVSHFEYCLNAKHRSSNLDLVAKSLNRQRLLLERPCIKVILAVATCVSRLCLSKRRNVIIARKLCRRKYHSAILARAIQHASRTPRSRSCRCLHIKKAVRCRPSR